MAEAAELLNFVEILHRTVILTEVGIKYLSADPILKRSLWKTELLTIPLFMKVMKLLNQAPKNSLSKQEIIQFLVSELPHQDAQIQLKMLIRWGLYGGLFKYHRKSNLFSLI